MILFAVVLVLVLWTVAVARVVERRAERRLAAVRWELRSDLDLLRDAQLGLAGAFVERWEGLDRAVSEGLTVAAREAEAASRQEDAKQRLERAAVAYLSEADAIIFRTTDVRGCALPMKVGHC